MNLVTASEEYNFTSFSNLPFYTKVNERLLDLAEVGKQRKIVDLGCGTGGITKLILERLQSAKDTVIYAVDHSTTALKAAAEEIGDRKDVAVNYVHSEVQNLTGAVKDKVDAVVYCNSIHYVPNKTELVDQIKDKLLPGGIFAFNTSFYEGSHPDDSLLFFRKWMMRSLRILKRDYGMTADKSAKVESRVQLKADDYIALVENAGFKVLVNDLNRVEVPHEGWHHISGFSDWIEGVMPGVPLDVGREALQKGLAQIWDEMNLKTIPRVWLSVSAAKA
ncbi:methyltransferase [Candidatus Lucifugimonas marina]|jgi:ubiquinone/menaquinone biosynthesis C-methylase UbiE|uniref:Methyltransferase n=1 Tax=Candidatus Lucifugimonas marina TaxID=3038979 RepID=A0AAJ5ZKM6_9CHLR|nr:methyltransferase [SAR202 cluster bacterium JH702]MDG0870479.1 methyltransferase [SAR202 cluster bacterium JH639]WFG35974.1 methyltransferase [SAR202 cluster bacterium JH545]WFG39918.1 methyltransferase [SAR202 cluster bacterium JH1073]